MKLILYYNPTIEEHLEIEASFIRIQSLIPLPIEYKSLTSIDLFNIRVEFISDLGKSYVDLTMRYAYFSCIRILFNMTPEIFAYSNTDDIFVSTLIENKIPEFQTLNEFDNEVFRLSTPSPTPTISPSLSVSVTPTITPTPSSSNTPTASVTPTLTITPSTTNTPTTTPSPTNTPTITPSPTNTPSVTPSKTPPSSPIIDFPNVDF